MILATVEFEDSDAMKAALITAEHPDKAVFTYEENGRVTVKVKAALPLMPSASESQMESAARSFASEITDKGRFRWERESGTGPWKEI